MDSKPKIELKFVEIPDKYKVKTANFIKRSKEKFGSRYLYHKTVSTGYKKLLTVTCKIHGDLNISPYNHFRRKLTGCDKCDLVKQCELFIKTSNERHDNKYDYSLVVYVDGLTDVRIICPSEGHGEFLQAPKHHLDLQGCRLCGNERIASSKLSNTEDFIVKAKNLHGNKYDYSKVNYVDCETQIIIICSVLHQFEQTPDNHLKGRGCWECSKERSSQEKRKPIEEFIQEANTKHNNKYDYSSTIYINSKIDVIIRCPTHGNFEQLPANHLNGFGCSGCSYPSEFACRTICEELTGLKFPKIRPDFLKNPETRRNLELDCFCESIKVAVEYNDHSSIFYRQTDDDYQNGQKRDILKQKLCTDNGMKLFYVPLKYTNRNITAMKEFIRQKFIEIDCEHHLLPQYRQTYEKIKLKMKTLHTNGPKDAN
jgi:hypothetical protein